MYLKKVHIRNFRGFLDETIELHPEITCIVGKNDAGKTSILQAIEYALTFQQAPIGSLNTEIESAHSGGHDPANKMEVVMEFQYRGLPHLAVDGFPDDLGGKRGTIVTRSWIGKPLKDKTRYEIHEIRLEDGSVVPLNQNVSIRFADVVILDQLSALPHTIKLTDINFEANRTIDKLFRYVIGNASAEYIQHMGDLNFTRRVLGSEKKLDSLLRSHFPSLGLKIKLNAHPEIHAFSIYLEDAQGLITGIASHGAGVRKLIALLTEIMFIPEGTFYIVLFDEPENSLHPNAQQALRIWLETIAKQDTIQIIYSTHSARMINTRRPGTVRMARVLYDNALGHTKHVIRNSPIDNNHAALREDLGFSIVDSLLIGDINLIVEGKTEAFCLDQLFDRMSKQNETTDALSRYGGCTILPSGGDSLIHWIRMARCLRGDLVIFVDGDKTDQTINWIQQGIIDAGELIQLPSSPKKMVFEDIVDRPVYIRALAGHYSDHKRMTPKAFEKFVASEEAKGHIKTFKKQIEGWLESLNLPTNFPKHDVMSQAINLATDAEIHWELLTPLLIKLRELTQEV